jgi:hypothetical protein
MDDKEHIKKIKDNILNSLYKHSSDKTYTSVDVLSRLLKDINKIPKVDTEDSLLEIIRLYKNTGQNLELTIDLLYDILYPPVPKKETSSKSDNINENDNGFDYT